MKRKEVILILLIVFPFIKIFSQTNRLDPITDTAANYTGNSSYNTGEVYVIYTIQNQSVVSKDSKDLNDSLNEKSIAEGISIYPNPVNNILTVVTPKGEKVNKIQLFSLDGKIISDQQIQNNQVDLSNLPQGTYILKTDFSLTKNFKIIKR